MQLVSIVAVEVIGKPKFSFNFAILCSVFIIFVFLLIWFVCSVSFKVVASDVLKLINNLCALPLWLTLRSYFSLSWFFWLGSIPYPYIFEFHFYFLRPIFDSSVNHLLIFNIFFIYVECEYCHFFIGKGKMRIQLGWRFMMILRLYYDILPC